MSNGRNPNKQLVPATRPEKPCPHDYSDDEGLVIEVDCTACRGAQDMENARCFAGLMNVVMAGAAPRSVVLRRYLDKRYRGTAVRRLLATAEMLASVNRAISALTRPSDRRCRTCPVSKERVLCSIRDAILRDPIGYSAGPSGVLEQVRGAAGAIRCDRRDECLRDASHLIPPRRS